jgi:colanic acid biosynthesis glycosyl transferase WcaI
MKILILTQYFPPEIGATPIRLFEIAKELSRQGHEVAIVTAMPNYPEGKTFSGYRGKLYLKEEMEGISVIRTWIYPATGKGIKRLLNFFSFTFTSSLGLIRASKPDYIFIESPPLFLGISGYLASRLKRLPYIFNVADLWLDEMLEQGIIKKRIPWHLAKKLELFLYRRAFVINAVTEGIVEEIVKDDKVTAQKVLFLPNGINLELFQPLPPDKELAMVLGVSGKKTFLYAGVHGYAQGLETILEAASILKDRQDLAFLMVGAGPVKENLQHKAQSEHLENMIFCSSYAYSAMPRIYSLAAAAIVPLRKGKLHEQARPSKILPPLACALPVIYSGRGEGARLIEEGRCGLVVEPENPQALAEAVVTLADDPQLASELGRKGRELVEGEYSWATIVNRWLKELEAKQNEQR